MGTYRIGVDELADEIFNLMYDLEGDWTLKDFIKASKQANLRIEQWHCHFRNRTHNRKKKK